MIKKLLSIVFLISCLSAKAQGEAVHITVDAAYFDPANLKFYKTQQNGTALEYSIYIDFDDESKSFEARLIDHKTGKPLQQYLTSIGGQAGDLVPMSEIKKGTVGYNKAVEDYTYRTLPKTTEGSNYFQSVAVANPDYFIEISNDGKADANGGCTYSQDASYRRFATLVINNTFTVYTDGKLYNLVHYNGGFNLYILGEYQIMQHGTGTQSEHFTALLRKTYPWGKEFTQSGKTGLLANDSNTVLIPPVYDSLFTQQDNFIVAYKKKKPYIFYRNGEPVKLDNLRAVYNLDRLMVLTGNNTFYLSHEGLPTNTVEARMVCGFNGQTRVTEETIIREPGFYILKRRFYSHDERDEAESEEELILAEGSEFKTLTFFDGSTAATHNRDEPNECLIAETRRGKRGIIKPDAFSGYSVLLPFEKQTLTYTHINNFVRMDTKNGRSGYWPLNKEARYTQLAEFTKGFARFTLPGGKQGWLALDGTEYLDE